MPSRTLAWVQAQGGSLPRVMAPPDEVLDLFAVPSHVRRIPGRRGSSVVAGDLLLTPHRDPATQEWLSPRLARLAAAVDTRPGRRRRDLRIAMPVPARDGSWTVRGWGAARFEPGTVACQDAAVAVAAGRVLHAELAAAFETPPVRLSTLRAAGGEPERLAFGAPFTMLASVAGLPGAQIVRRVEPYLDQRELGADQLVHTRVATTLLLDEAGAPVVADVAPAWRPVAWAEALSLVDAVAHLHGDPEALRGWRRGLPRQAILRALAYRGLADRTADPAPYASVLDAVAPSVY